MAFLALIIINGLVGMHFGHFWPPRTPGGCQGGYGGSGGVRGTKIFNFLWGHIWVPKCEILDCINWKHNFFQVFGQKQPLKRSKMAFLGSNGYAKKWIFLKNTIFKLAKIAPKVPFLVNNNVRKWWAWSFIENFSGCQNWDFWSCSHAHWEKRSYMPDVAMKGLKWP